VEQLDLYTTYTDIQGQTIAVKLADIVAMERRHLKISILPTAPWKLPARIAMNSRRASTHFSRLRLGVHRRIPQRSSR